MTTREIYLTGALVVAFLTLLAVIAGGGADMKFLYLLALLHGDPQYASMMTVVGPFGENLLCMVTAMRERENPAAISGHEQAGCVVEEQIRTMIVEHECEVFESPNVPFDPNVTNFVCAK